LLFLEDTFFVKARIIGCRLHVFFKAISWKLLSLYDQDNAVDADRYSGGKHLFLYEILCVEVNLFFPASILHICVYILRLSLQLNGNK